MAKKPKKVYTKIGDRSGTQFTFGKFGRKHPVKRKKGK